MNRQPVLIDLYQTYKLHDSDLNYLNYYANKILNKDQSYKTNMNFQWGSNNQDFRYRLQQIFKQFQVYVNKLQQRVTYYKDLQYNYKKYQIYKPYFKIIQKAQRLQIKQKFIDTRQNFYNLQHYYKQIEVQCQQFLYRIDALRVQPPLQITQLKQTISKKNEQIKVYEQILNYINEPQMLKPRIQNKQNYQYIKPHANKLTENMKMLKNIKQYQNTINYYANIIPQLTQQLNNKVIVLDGIQLSLKINKQQISKQMKQNFKMYLANQILQKHILSIKKIKSTQLVSGAFYDIDKYYGLLQGAIKQIIQSLIQILQNKYSFKSVNYFKNKIINLTKNTKINDLLTNFMNLTDQFRNVQVFMNSLKQIQFKDNNFQTLNHSISFLRQIQNSYGKVYHLLKNYRLTSDEIKMLQRHLQKQVLYKIISKLQKQKDNKDFNIEKIIQKCNKLVGQKSITRLKNLLSTKEYNKQFLIKSKTIIRQIHNRELKRNTQIRYWNTQQSQFYSQLFNQINDINKHLLNIKKIKLSNVQFLEDVIQKIKIQLNQLFKFDVNMVQNVSSVSKLYKVQEHEYKKFITKSTSEFQQLIKRIKQSKTNTISSHSNNLIRTQLPKKLNLQKKQSYQKDVFYDNQVVNSKQYKQLKQKHQSLKNQFNNVIEKLKSQIEQKDSLKLYNDSSQQQNKKLLDQINKLTQLYNDVKKQNKNLIQQKQKLQLNNKTNSKSYLTNKTYQANSQQDLKQNIRNNNKKIQKLQFQIQQLKKSNKKPNDSQSQINKKLIQLIQILTDIQVNVLDHQNLYQQIKIYQPNTPSNQLIKQIESKLKKIDLTCKAFNDLSNSTNTLTKPKITSFSQQLNKQSENRVKYKLVQQKVHIEQFLLKFSKFMLCNIIQLFEQLSKTKSKQYFTNKINIYINKYQNQLKPNKINQNKQLKQKVSNFIQYNNSNNLFFNKNLFILSQYTHLIPPEAMFNFHSICNFFSSSKKDQSKQQKSKISNYIDIENQNLNQRLQNNMQLQNQNTTNYVLNLLNHQVNQYGLFQKNPIQNKNLNYGMQNNQKGRSVGLNYENQEIIINSLDAQEFHRKLTNKLQQQMVEQDNKKQWNNCNKITQQMRSLRIRNNQLQKNEWQNRKKYQQNRNNEYQNKKYQKLNEQYENLRQKVFKIDFQIKQKEQKITQLNGLLKQKLTIIQKLTHENNLLSKQTVILKSKNDDLIYKNNELTNKNNQLTKITNDLDEDIKKYQQLLQNDSQLKDLVQIKQRQIAEYKKFMNQMQTKYNLLNTNYESQKSVHQSLKLKYSQLNSNYQQLSSQSNSLKQQHSTLQQYNKKLAGSYQKLIKQYNTIQNKLSQSIQNNNILSANIIQNQHKSNLKLQSQLLNLKTSLQSSFNLQLVQYKAEIQQQIQCKSNQINLIKQQLTTKQFIITQKQKQLKSCLQNIHSLSNQKLSLQTKNNHLQTQLQSKSNQLLQLQQKIKQLQAQTIPYSQIPQQQRKFLDQKDIQIRTLTIQKNTLKKNLKKCKDDLKQLDNKYSKEIKELKIANSRSIQQANKKVKAAEYQLQILKKNNVKGSNQQENRFASNNQLSARQKLDYNKVKNELEKQKLKTSTVQQQKNQQIQKLKVQIDKLNLSNREKQTQIKKQKQKIDSLEISQVKDSQNQISKKQEKESHLVVFDRFFSGQTLDAEYTKKYQLLSAIQSKAGKGKVLKTKFIYKFDLKNPTSFHSYVDGVKNFLIIVKTKKNVFGAFTTSKIQPKYKEPFDTKAFIFTFSNQNEIICFDKKENSKSLTYDEYFLIVGNSEIRLRSGEKIVFSNFGINNGYYDSKGANVSALLKADDSREDALEGYECYQVCFEKDDKQQEEERRFN